MGKVKVPEAISLVQSKQKEFTKKTRLIKKKVKKTAAKSSRATAEQKSDVKPERGLIYIAHLPHGFYEEAISGYFKQFGKVTNVKVCRSSRNGNSKGYAYVEFSHPEVAKIAAETMDNYLMFKRRLTATYVENDKRPKYLFGGQPVTPENCSGARKRQRTMESKNKEIDDDTYKKKCKTTLTRLQSKMEKLKKYGIVHNFKPVDVPAVLKKKVKK